MSCLGIWYREVVSRCLPILRGFSHGAKTGGKPNPYYFRLTTTADDDADTWLTNYRTVWRIHQQQQLQHALKHLPLINNDYYCYTDNCHLHCIELQQIPLPSNQATKLLYHSHLWVSTMYQSRQLEAFFATFYDFNYQVKVNNVSNAPVRALTWLTSSFGHSSASVL